MENVHCLDVGYGPTWPLPVAQRPGLLGVGNSVLFMTHVAITVGAC